MRITAQSRPLEENCQATDNEQHTVSLWNKVCQAILYFIQTYVLCCCYCQNLSPSRQLTQYRVQRSDQINASIDIPLEELEELDNDSEYLPEGQRSASAGDAESSIPRGMSLVNLGSFAVGSRNLPGEWKEITDVYARTDYNGNPVARRFIPRVQHGAQHQSRTAMWGLVLLQLLRAHGVPEALSFNDRDINLIILACLFHDSGRQGEGEDNPVWERNSGLNCRTFMTRHGYSKADIAICQAAITYKSRQSAFPYKSNSRARLLLWILHFADALDVIRVRSGFAPDIPIGQCEDFPPDNIVDVTRAYRDLAIVVRQVVIDQRDWVTGGQYSHRMKRRFEKAPNPLIAQFQHLRVSQPETFRQINTFVHSLLAT